MAGGRGGGLLALAVAGHSVAQSVEDFARMPAIWAAKVSPDGRWLATGCRQGEVLSLCAYDLDQGGGPIVYAPDEELRLSGFEFVGPSHLALRVRFFSTLNTSSGLRDVRATRAIAFDLENRTGSMLLDVNDFILYGDRIESRLDGDPERILMSVTRRSSGGRSTGALVAARAEYLNTLYRVNLADGGGRRIESDRILGRIMTPAGETVATYDSDPATGDFSIRNPSTRRELYSGAHAGEEPIVHGLSDAGGLVVQFASGPRRGMNRLDLESGELSFFDKLGPELIAQPIFDPADAHLVGFEAYRDDLDVQLFTDETLSSTVEALAGALGAERVILENWTYDRSRFVLRTLSPGAPDEYYLFDRTAGSVSVISVWGDPTRSARVLAQSVSGSFDTFALAAPWPPLRRRSRVAR